MVLSGSEFTHILAAISKLVFSGAIIFTIDPVAFIPAERWIGW
jgi:hypothetical protein